jgi:LacI family transcriptional regulator
VLGLAISEITNPFFPELVQSFETLAAKGDYEVLLGSVIHNDAHAKQFIRRLVQRRVEGVAVMTFRAESDYLRELIAHNIPLVTIDSGVNSPRSLVIEPDYESGINEAVQYLAVLGHRRIGFIRGPAEHKTNELRLQAFLASVARIGQDTQSTPLFAGDHTFEAGAAAAEYFMGLEKPPTAIMSANDLMAVGVLRVLGDRGINVPGEISVVGFDDIHLAQFVHPPLSTVRMPREELAAAAFQGLMRLAHQDSSDETPLRVLTRFVVRQSTASPPATRVR